MLSGLCGEELGYSTMRVCSEGESEMGVSGAKKNQSGEGAVRFWRRRERTCVASGENDGGIEKKAVAGFMRGKRRKINYKRGRKRRPTSGAAFIIFSRKRGIK